MPLRVTTIQGHRKNSRQKSLWSTQVREHYVGRSGSPRASPAPPGRAAARWRPYPAPLAPARRRGAPSVQYRHRARDAWDGKEKKTSVRSVVLGAVREASGDVSARPEGVRAMSRNAAALEAVIARADLATRAEAAFLASVPDEPEAAANVHVVGLIDVHEPSALSRDEAGEATGLAAPQGRPPRAPRGGAPHL